MGTRISADVRPFLLPEADRHVVSRFAYGVDEALVDECRTAGSGLRWFERQLQPRDIADPAADQLLSWFPLLRDDPATRYRKSVTGGPGAQQYGLSQVDYWMAHAVVTRRQVHAQMVAFWGNLLYLPAFEELRSFPWRLQFEQTIRSLALTSFKDLLKACVIHPAMSAYLNNNENTAQGINENLGRELLELHTVGRAAGYTEAHVRDAARLLTGFRTRRGDDIEAWYDPTKHWTGPVSVLGFRHTNSSADGRAALNALLDYLALHPSTAKRLAFRLCQRFVSDSPPAEIVSAVATAYTASGSDIRSTLRALVRHPQFASTQRAKVRTPIEDVVSIARVLGVAPTKPVDEVTSFVRQLALFAGTAGEAPFRWPRPDGYPEMSGAFLGPTRLLYSWTHRVYLTANTLKATSISRPTPGAYLPQQWPRRLDELVEHQSRILLGRSTDPALLKMITGQLQKPASFIYRNVAAVPEAHLNLIRASILILPEGLKR